jgi:hypothetical protein
MVRRAAGRDQNVLDPRIPDVVGDSGNLIVSIAQEALGDVRLLPNLVPQPHRVASFSG